MADGRIIALYGYPGSGKDSVASFLVEQGGWTRVAFVDPVKEMLVALDPIIEIYSDYSTCTLSQEMEKWDLDLEGVKRTCPEVRRLLQRLGTEAGREVLGEDVWVNAAEDRIFRGLEAGRVVVTDMRFPNEYRAMCDLNAVIVEVRRPGYGPVNGHASEKHYGSFIPQYILHNEGTLDDLRASVDAMLCDIGVKREG